MSKKIVALRPRSPKPLKVVPIRPRRLRPIERAQIDLEVQTEIVSGHLKGLRNVLEAWIEYEHSAMLFSDTRTFALDFLGFAAVQVGASLDATIPATSSPATSPWASSR